MVKILTWIEALALLNRNSALTWIPSVHCLYTVQYVQMLQCCEKSVLHHWHVIF